jgi:hypothetical protein
MTQYGQVTALGRYSSVLKTEYESGDRRLVKAVLGKWWKEQHMHETHREAAELHELAADAHRTAAEHNEKGNEGDAIWHAERALEYSEHAYRMAKESQNKSGQMVTV